MKVDDLIKSGVIKLDSFVTKYERFLKFNRNAELILYLSLQNFEPELMSMERLCIFIIRVNGKLLAFKCDDLSNDRIPVNFAIKCIDSAIVKQSSSLAPIDRKALMDEVKRHEFADKV